VLLSGQDKSGNIEHRPTDTAIPDVLNSFREGGNARRGPKTFHAVPRPPSGRRACKTVERLGDRSKAAPVRGGLQKVRCGGYSPDDPADELQGVLAAEGWVTEREAVLLGHDAPFPDS